MDKHLLVKKSVMVKLRGLGRPLTSMIGDVDDDGYWFIGGDLLAELGKGGLPPYLTSKAVIFVPISQIEWMIAPQVAAAPAAAQAS